MTDRESRYFTLTLEQLRAIGGWAADCAEGALPMFETRAKSDSRPRAAIPVQPPPRALRQCGGERVLLEMPARQPGKSRLEVLLYELDAGIRARTWPRDA